MPTFMTICRKFNESGIKSIDSIFNQAENLGPVNSNDKENEQEGPGR